LPSCVDFANQEYCNKIGSDGDECPLQKEAHDIIKWSAKAKAEGVYLRWREKKKKAVF
jgi:hypothetical protein